MYNHRSPRILVTQLGDVRDCVCSLPLVCALRDHFAKALIVWAAESPHEQLLSGHRAPDELYVVRRGWTQSLGEMRRIKSELRRLQFDLAIDAQGTTASAAAAWLSGAPRRIGFARGVGRGWSRWLNNERLAPKKSHRVDQSLELLKSLGIRAPEVQFKVPLDGRAHVAVREFIGRMHLGCGFAVLDPAGQPSADRWPEDRFGHVARHLGQRQSLPSLVVWSDDAQRRWAEAVVAHSGGHALAAPKFRLTEFASLLRCSRLYVGGDSAWMHLAYAVGTDCVVLRSAAPSPVNGPYGRRHVVVESGRPACRSMAHRRVDDAAASLIDSESVCGACDRILQRQNGERALRSAA